MSEQPEQITEVKRLELAMRELGPGPKNSAIGQVVEDCALVHMDYLGGVDMAASMIAETIGEITGETPTEVSARLRPYRQCDCPARGCAGPEKSAEAHEAYRAHLLDNLTPEFRAALSSKPSEEGRFTADEKSLLIARLARGKSAIKSRAEEEEPLVDKLMALLDSVERTQG